MTTLSDIFYVYAYLRKDGSPYYIGKGKGSRAYGKDHSVFVPDKSRIIFLAKNLDEKTAFVLEKFWIKVYGRKDLGEGTLRNKTDGGDGAANPSQETRQKLSDALKGRKSPMTGRKHKECSKTQTSQSVKKSYEGRVHQSLGKINIHGKAVITPYGRFNSARHASTELGLPYHIIIRRCIKGSDGWARLPN